MKQTVRATLAQIDIESLNSQANLAKVEEMVAKIAEEGPVDLVVFPALVNSGYPRADDKGAFLATAESEGGTFIAGLKKLARQHRIHLVAGVLEADPKSSQTAFDSGVFINPSGEVLGWQRQLHLVGQDKDTFSQGDAIKVFSSSLGNIALIVGTDLEFPEVLRVQALQGAEIACSLLNRRKEVENPAEWLALVAICRAMESKVYFLACNRVGQQGDNVFFGASCIAHPGSELLAPSASAGEDVVRADLSADLFIEERAVRPYFRDRRPENYGMVCR